jgi:hypothetical protein
VHSYRYNPTNKDLILLIGTSAEHPVSDLQKVDGPSNIQARATMPSPERGHNSYDNDSRPADVSFDSSKTFASTRATIQ